MGPFHVEYAARPDLPLGGLAPDLHAEGVSHLGNNFWILGGAASAFIRSCVIDAARLLALHEKITIARRILIPRTKPQSTHSSLSSQGNSMSLRILGIVKSIGSRRDDMT